MENIALSRDVAQLVDAMHATPYDVSYDYPEYFYTKNLVLNNSMVVVSPEDMFSSAKQAQVLFGPSHPIHESEFITMETQQTFDLASFTLQKKGSTIEVINPLLKEDEKDNPNDPTPENLEQSTIHRKEVILHISSSRDTSTISSLEQQLKTELSLKDFNISTEKPTLHIRFVQGDSQGVGVYIDKGHAIELQKIASNINTYLSHSTGIEVLDTPITMKEEQDVATIEIRIGNDEQTKQHFRSKENKNMFVEKITLALDKYYPKQ